MNKKFKIFFISNTPEFFSFFMINHIKKLSTKYDIFVCCENANSLKKKLPKNVFFININLKRNLSILSDIKVFFVLLFHFLKNKT